MSKTLYLRVDDDLAQLVHELAAETGWTINAVATYLLRRGTGIRPMDPIEAALDRRHSAEGGPQ